MKTETYKMWNASNKLLAVEFFTINSFFLSFNSTDVAYTLACFAMVICGISLRMIMLYKKAQKEGSSLTRQMVIMHFISAVCICWVSYYGWHQGLDVIFPFKFLGLPIYLCLCSFFSMYILEQMEKFGEISIPKIPGMLFKMIYEKFFMDVKNSPVHKDNEEEEQK